MDPFQNLNKPVPGLKFLSPLEAFEALQKGGALVDLRTDELVEMDAFAVPTIFHIPHRFLPASYSELPKDRLLVLADTSGVYTKEAARLLFANGFTQIVCLNGGMSAWKDASLPVGTDDDAVLYGPSPKQAITPKSRKPMAQSLLFLDVTNSTRSQLAEGVARKLFPGLRVMSAGNHPEPVDPLTVEVLKEIGVETDTWTSQEVSSIDPSTVGAVITLCAEEVGPRFSGNVDRLHWPLADPARGGLSVNRQERLNRFRTTRDELWRLLEAFGRERGLLSRSASRIG